jgi:hypothetical protein
MKPFGDSRKRPPDNSTGDNHAQIPWSSDDRRRAVGANLRATHHFSVSDTPMPRSLHGHFLLQRYPMSGTTTFHSIMSWRWNYQEGTMQNAEQQQAKEKKDDCQV